MASNLICLTGDGFTNIKLINLLNFEALTRAGPVHVGTAQRTAKHVKKDAKYLATLIIEEITKLGGIEKVVGFVSDNESCMREVWRILEEELPRFLTCPCVCHVGSLLLKAATGPC